MSGSNLQIVTAYETAGLTPEEIAEQFSFELVAVKAILMQNSAEYRKACRSEPEESSELNFSDENLKLANDTILQLLQYSEDDHLRSRLARYVRDDKKGRLDVVKQLSKVNVNMVQFNIHMQQAIAAKQRALENKKVVDIQSTSEPVKQLEEVA